MKSEQPSTSSRLPSPVPKPNISSVSERLTNSEIEELRRDLRENPLGRKRNSRRTNRFRANLPRPSEAPAKRVALHFADSGSAR